MRVNKGNRPTIEAYIRSRFNEIADANGGNVGMVSVWDVEIELQARFAISDPASQKIVADVGARGPIQSEEEC